MKAALGKAVVPDATLVAFAASPGRKAAAFLSESDENSPFTKFLTDELATGTGNLRDLVEAAAETTEVRTGKRQVPYVTYTGAASAIRQIVFRTSPAAMPVIPRRADPAPLTDAYTLLAGKTAGERRLIEVAAGVTLPFRWCPAGSFSMGSPASEKAKLKAAGKAEDFYSDEVQHEVTLTKGFWLAETEVTQGQWQAVMGTTLLQQANKALADDAEYTINGKKQTLRALSGMQKGDGAKMIGVESEKVAMYHVNWEDADEFCTKASRHAGQRGWAITLPTEAQWEYACRSGTSGMTYAGNFDIKGENNAPGLDAIAWYGGNSSEGYSGTGWSTTAWKEKQYPGGNAGPRRVGGKQANEWGLCDMIGNVWEWCADYYGPYATGSATDPTGAATGAYRVFRGGSWGGAAARCRAALRGHVEPGDRGNHLGFRPALVPSR